MRLLAIGDDNRHTGLDCFGRIIDQSYLNTSNGTTVDRLQYGYDRDSNVLYQNNLVNGSFSELYHANSATTGDNNSAYDPLSRLTSFRRGTLTSSTNNGTGLDTITTANLNSTTGVPTTNQWNYDALGNWTSSVPNGTSTSNTFNSQNEETGNGSSTLAYDHNGDMTTDQAGNLYTYDAWGHVIRIASSSNSTEEVFQYDAQGRAVVNNNGSGTENRYYSGGNIIQEQFSSTNYAQYVYGLAYVNDVILRDRNADGNNSTGNLGITGSGLEEREYAQHDTQFSVISLTDSTGAVMQRFIYDPYGTITVLTPSWAYDTSGGGTNYWLYTFQGMRIVDAPGTSGMLFSATRIYDAPLGRWISQDRGYWDGMNTYSFAGSSPTGRVDPSGKAYLVTVDPDTGEGGAGSHSFLVINAPSGKQVVFTFTLPNGWNGPIPWADYVKDRGAGEKLVYQNLGKSLDRDLFNDLTKQVGGKSPYYGKGGEVCSSASAGALEATSHSKALQEALNEFFNYQGVKGPTLLMQIIEQYLHPSTFIIPGVQGGSNGSSSSWSSAGASSSAGSSSSSSSSSSSGS